MKRFILFDTSVLCALNNPKDQYTAIATQLSKKVNEAKLLPVTTDYVIDEASTLLLTRARSGFLYANNLLENVIESNLFEVIWINKQKFYAAVKVFKRFNQDKRWSFTDCTSYVVMKELGIKTAFTFDENFKEMGFEILR